MRKIREIQQIEPCVYLVLGSGEFSISVVFRLSWNTLGPDDDANVNVGEGENGQRQEVLEDHDDEGLEDHDDYGLRDHDDYGRKYWRTMMTTA